jgi:hypothetical protein
VPMVAAPEYVPQPAVKHVRTYYSPPRRPDSWRAERPGDSATVFPRGERLGSPGPDQGYIYLLARRFEGRLQLQPGEHQADVIAGCAAVALKRASLFGRAPMPGDLTVAFTLWGYLGDASDELVELRRKMFAEVSNPADYGELRRIPDAVSEEVLRKTPEEAAEAHSRDWRALLHLSA